MPSRTFESRSFVILCYDARNRSCFVNGTYISKMLQDVLNEIMEQVNASYFNEMKVSHAKHKDSETIVILLPYKIKVTLETKKQPMPDYTPQW